MDGFVQMGLCLFFSSSNGFLWVLLVVGYGGWNFLNHHGHREPWCSWLWWLEFFES